MELWISGEVLRHTVNGKDLSSTNGTEASSSQTRVDFDLVISGGVSDRQEECFPLGLPRWEDSVRLRSPSCIRECLLAPQESPHRLHR